MWAAILIGAGMALTAAWSGAPALYPGVITRLEKVNRALQAVSGRTFRGSSLMDNGVQEAITIWLPEMQFSLIGFCGGLLYMLAYNVFPYFSDSLYYSYLLGASASVLAIVVATAVREPDYPVHFMFIGTVRLKYVALFMVVTDLLFMTSGNAGGHIAHLGGALAGWWFASGLTRGHDATAWINRFIDWVASGFTVHRSPKKPKMKVHYGDKAKDYEYNARKKQNSDEIDRILDKLRKSGYDSLTSDEKKSLFDASKK